MRVLFQKVVRLDFSNCILFFLASICILPVSAVIITAFGDSNGLINHLFSTVLGRYLGNTLSLMILTALVSLVFGLSSAWVVSRYRFPFRQSFEWLLILPAAVPAYIIAFTYTDFFEYSGPLQTLLRQIFGWSSAKDYWFPQIRSLGGAAFVMGSVLYPYVYVMARTSFSNTSPQLYEAASLHGRNSFTDVGLPLARPAIVASLALVLMEVISDFGTVEYFAIETLTLGIFNVWLGMNNLTAAAQLSCFAFFLIILVLVIERLARSHRAFQYRSSADQLPKKYLSKKHRVYCILICVFPIIFGFGIPVSVLLNFVFKNYSVLPLENTFVSVFNTVLVASVAALMGVSISLILAVLAKYKSGQLGKTLASFSAFGYAFPGTILAIGVVYVSSSIDYLWQELGEFFSFSTGFLFSGSLGVLVLAYFVRFHAISYGSIQTGLSRVNNHSLEASYLLGNGFLLSFLRVILPLLRPSITVASLLVFVEIMKELPMTLLLRPFGFETLATLTYQYAKDELLEQSALPALLIVLSGLLPVIFLNRILSSK